MILPTYWITLAVPMLEDESAQIFADSVARLFDARVIDVQPEPPQGATVVGDMRED